MLVCCVVLHALDTRWCGWCNNLRSLRGTSVIGSEKPHQLRGYLRVDEDGEHGHNQDTYDNAGYPGRSHIKSLLLRLRGPQYCSNMSECHIMECPAHMLVCWGRMTADF